MVVLSGNRVSLGRQALMRPDALCFVESDTESTLQDYISSSNLTSASGACWSSLKYCGGYGTEIGLGTTFLRKFAAVFSLGPQLPGPSDHPQPMSLASMPASGNKIGFGRAAHNSAVIASSAESA